MSKPKYTVGQDVWYVPKASYNAKTPTGYPAKVEWVGRVWMTVTSERGCYSGHTILVKKTVRKESGYEKEGEGRLYLSEAEYQDSTVRDHLWVRFRNSLPYHPPAALTLPRVRELLAEFGIEEPS